MKKGLSNKAKLLFFGLCMSFCSFLSSPTEVNAAGTQTETISASYNSDTWSWSGTKTFKTKYYLIGNGTTFTSPANIFENVPIDDSLTFTIKGGTFGGGSYNGYKVELLDSSDNSIASTTSTVSGSSETGSNTCNVSLSGILDKSTISKIKFSGTSGNGTNNGVRFTSISVTYTYSNAKLSSISVKTPPTKTSYIVGEHFDPTGLVITKSFTDSSEEDFTYADHPSDFTFSPTITKDLETSDTSVSITVGGKTTSQSISVNTPKTPLSLTLSNKTVNYKIGSSFIPPVATVEYSDSTSKEVTANYTGYDLNSVGSQTVTGSYTESSIDVQDSYSISVKTIQSISASGSLIAVKDANWDTSSLIITANWESPFEPEELKSSDYTITCNPTTAILGTTSVTISISYKGGLVSNLQTSVSCDVQNLIVDTLTRATTGIENSSYTDWSNKTATSSAIYAGNSAGSNNSIQLRTTKSNAGVVSTTSGGVLSKVVISWNNETANGRAVKIFGSNIAYKSPADCFDTDKQGTLIAQLSKDNDEKIAIPTKEFAYVGIIAYGGALYLNSISIYWGPSNELQSVTVTNQTTTFTAGDTFSLGSSANVTATYSQTGDKTVSSGLSYTLNGNAITTSTILTYDDNGKSVIVTYTDEKNDNVSATAYTITVNYKNATSVVINGSSSISLSINEIYSFNATINDQYTEQSVIWSLANDSGTGSLIDSSTGQFTAGSTPGTVNVIATSSIGAVASEPVTVTISAGPVVSVSKSAIEGIANVTDDEYIEAIASNFNSITSYDWVSTDSSIASVESADEICIIKFLHEGSTVITVTVYGTDNADQSVSTSTTVSVTVTKQLASITAELIDTSKTYAENTTVPVSDLTVTKTYSDGQTAEAIGFIVTDGLVTQSDSTITVSYTEDKITKTDDVSVTVVMALLDTLSFTNKTLTYKEGDTSTGTFTLGNNASIIAKYKTSFSDESVVINGEVQSEIKGTLGYELQRRIDNSSNYNHVCDINLGDPMLREYNGLYLRVSYTYGSSTVYAQREKITVNAPEIKGKVTEEAPESWTLVTDTAQLSLDSQVIIAAKDSNYAMSTTQNSSNRGQAAITKNNTTITWESTSNVQIFTLKAGTISNTWSFYDGSNYIYAASSNNNYLKSQGSNDDNSSFSISISSNSAKIVAQGLNTKNTIKYNLGSSLFSCYSTGQSEICLYKHVGGKVDNYYTISDELYDALNSSQTLLNEECALKNVSSTTWSTISGLITPFLTDSESNDYKVLMYAEAKAKDNGGNILEDFLARYDLITKQYNYEKFISANDTTRNDSAAELKTYFNINKDSILYIAIISLIGLSTIGGYFFYKKHKEEF